MKQFAHDCYIDCAGDGGRQSCQFSLYNTTKDWRVSIRDTLVKTRALSMYCMPQSLSFLLLYSVKLVLLCFIDTDRIFILLYTHAFDREKFFQLQLLPYWCVKVVLYYIRCRILCRPLSWFNDSNPLLSSWFRIYILDNRAKTNLTKHELTLSKWTFANLTP